MTEKMNIAPQSALPAAELELMNRYWQAANYLPVGQIYLLIMHRCANLCDLRTSNRGCSAI
jgi:phosphoketolase